MIQNKKIVVRGGKDYIMVIMKQPDYLTKLDTMIDGDIIKDKYIETRDFKTFYMETFIPMSPINHET